ncbi:hypothetical protein PMAYCL1PPCAC_29003, partial [Pristionchus mayeri]
RMLLLTASLVAAVVSFPFEITPQPVFPVPETTPFEPCGLATRVCMGGSDCASGFCSIVEGATTGCCQDTQWPLPGPQPTPPPFEPSACPLNIPLCISDSDCGFSGYCNHTVGGDNFFGCCQFGPAPSDGPVPPGFPTNLPFPDPDPAPTPVPTGEGCPISVPLCISDSDCSHGETCNHLTSNSPFFGCCSFVGPAPSIGPFPFPFPDPMPTAAPVDLCLDSASLCISDADCGAESMCSHTASNSLFFGCCHFVGVPTEASPLPFPMPDPVPSTVVPFFPPEEQPRCSAELGCLVDSDCEKMEGRCEFVFGNSIGCCSPKFD